MNYYEEPQYPQIDIPKENWGKTRYIKLNGFESSVYFNDATMLGNDKHTDRPVKIFWSDEDGQYHEEEFDFSDHFKKFPPKPVEPFVRVQPKQMTRKQRLQRGR